MNTLLEITSAISVEELGTVEELEALEGEWAELWARCPHATPFQSPDWLIPWWKHLGQGELWVLAVRQQSRLSGLAPFTIHTTAEGRRQVLVVGTGISDYLDVLAEEGAEAEVAAAIFSHLEAQRDRWDECDFQQLQEHSPLLQAPPPPAWTGQLTVQEVCPVLELAAPAERFSAHVPANMLEKLRYYRRRLQKLGNWRMERAQAENFAELFGRFLELHRARWNSRGQNGVLPDARLQDFHREAAQRLLASGALRLYGLRVGDCIQASYYGFAHGHRAFYYLGGFAPELAPLSPGTLMIGHAMEAAAREGATAFDFLRGREAYKYMWGAKGRLNYRKQLTLS